MRLRAKLAEDASKARILNRRRNHPMQKWMQLLESSLGRFKSDAKATIDTAKAKIEYKARTDLNDADKAKAIAEVEER